MSFTGIPVRTETANPPKLLVLHIRIGSPHDGWGSDIWILTTIEVNPKVLAPASNPRWTPVFGGLNVERCLNAVPTPPKRLEGIVISGRVLGLVRPYR